MSNYADPSATRTVFLEPCGCPGRPHARDSATILERIGYGIKGAVREATRRSGLEAGHLVLILRSVKAWTFVLPDGSPRPIDVTQVELLDDRTVQWLLDELDVAWEEDELPNAPSAPSPDGSQESAGPTPTTQTSTETSPGSTST